ILGVAAFRSIGANPALGLIFPVAARAIGVLASIVGVFAVRATARDRSAMAPINRGFFTASILTVVGTLAVSLIYIGNDHDNEGWKVFGAVVAGLVLAQVISRLTEHFTSTDKEPVQEIADSARTGPATTVLSGTSTGLESSVWAIVAISVAVGVAIILGNGNIEFSFYLVALTGMGMLVGGSIAFLFSALAIRAVGRTAGTVVQDVRDQFSDGKIMAGTKQPDSGRIVDICTAASLRELATPALLAVLTPVIIGFGMNYLALGAFLAALILTGQ